MTALEGGSLLLLARSDSPEEQGGWQGGEWRPGAPRPARTGPPNPIRQPGRGALEGPPRASPVPCSHQTLLQCRSTLQVLLKELACGDPSFLLMPLGLIKSP